ncbi:MAG: pyridoxal-phosphate dependent enzyme, partial [Rhodothermales bacterium]
MANRPTGWGGPPVTAPDLAEIKTAAQRISTVAVRTPLVPLHSYDGTTDLWLKPEVLQPIGSFKLRGVYNWAASLSAEERQRGLVTTSAGNTAQALGYVARLFGVTARALVPDWLPANKMASILN